MCEGTRLCEGYRDLYGDNKRECELVATHSFTVDSGSMSREPDFHLSLCGLCHADMECDEEYHQSRLETGCDEELL